MKAQRIILDQQTPFSEVMAFINFDEDLQGRVNRLRSVIQKHPQLKHMLDIYFGHQEHKLKKIASLLDGVQRYPVGVGILNQINYTRFIDNINTLFSDDVVIPDAARVSQLSSLFDYTLEEDEKVIRKIILLEEIEEFTTMGLDVYNTYLGI